MRGSFFIGKLYRRCFGINDLMINEEIRDREVRVVDQNGEQLGVMSGRDALALAEERQLDLVKIAPQARPPVCKLMDYGKYRFEQSKKEREFRKNQKVITVKEVRLSATIEDHDPTHKTGSPKPTGFRRRFAYFLDEEKVGRRRPTPAEGLMLCGQ